MNSIEAFRRFYARYILASVNVNNDRLRDAFATVERERFIGPGPWQIAVGEGYISTESDDPRLLYQNILIGLATGQDINNGEPSLHALCIHEANPQEGEVVVHVGAGTGYYTAILAHLVGTRGSVHAYEIDPELASRAAAHLSQLPQVAVHAESAITTLPRAEVIYVSAGATFPPDQWLDGLATGGRMVLPLVPYERLGCMLLITRCTDAKYTARIFSDANFIPCLGARDEESSQSLAEALNLGRREEVRSLHRHTTPDETAWCAGTGWWLSTADVIE